MSIKQILALVATLTISPTLATDLILWTSSKQEPKIPYGTRIKIERVNKVSIGGQPWINQKSTLLDQEISGNGKANRALARAFIIKGDNSIKNLKKNGLQLYNDIKNGDIITFSGPNITTQAFTVANIDDSQILLWVVGGTAETALNLQKGIDADFIRSK